jgi:hypothetical protein
MQGCTQQSTLYVCVLISSPSPVLFLLPYSPSPSRIRRDASFWTDNAMTLTRPHALLVWRKTVPSKGVDEHEGLIL